jgi:hypothetical protein
LPVHALTPGRSRSRSNTTLLANSIISSTAQLIDAFPAPPSPDNAIAHCKWIFHYANAVIDPTTGASLGFP